MGQLLLYLPNLNVANEQTLAQRGVRDLIGPSINSRHVASGPDSTTGAIVGSAAEGLGYYPDRQRWTQAEGGDYWIGFDVNDPPGPEDLARAEQVDGHPVTLADGNEWIVPIIRSVLRGSALPQALVLDSEGNWTGRPLEAYARHEADAERIWQHVLSEIGREDEAGASPHRDELSHADVIAIAVRALAINYRLNQWVVSALGVFTTPQPFTVGLAMVDWQAVEQMAESSQKKSPAPDESSTSDGVTGSPQATSPASAT